MPKPVLGGRQEVPTRTARRQVQSRNRSRGERCQIRDKTQSNLPTPRAPELRTEVNPCISSLKSKKTPSCCKWACGRRPSHASTGQQRSTQKNPHRDANTATNQQPHARSIPVRNQAQVHCHKSHAQNSTAQAKWAPKKEKEPTAQRTENTLEIMEKTLRENRKDRRRAG